MLHERNLYLAIAAFLADIGSGRLLRWGVRRSDANVESQRRFGFALRQKTSRVLLMVGLILLGCGTAVAGIIPGGGFAYTDGSSACDGITGPSVVTGFGSYQTALSVLPSTTLTSNGCGILEDSATVSGSASVMSTPAEISLDASATATLTQPSGREASARALAELGFFVTQPTTFSLIVSGTGSFFVDLEEITGLGSTILVGPLEGQSGQFNGTLSSSPSYAFNVIADPSTTVIGSSSATVTAQLTIALLSSLITTNQFASPCINPASGVTCAGGGASLTGPSNINVGGPLDIGTGGGNGTLTVGPATLAATSLVVGQSSGGTATVQSGGTIQADSLTVGGSSAGSLTIQDGGTVKVTGTTKVGDGATGSVAQNGSAALTTANLTIGNQKGSNGTYTMSGGSLSVGGTEVIGNTGTGTFTQNGGTVNVAGTVEIGNGGTSTGEGNYDLKGGSLSAQSISIGNPGVGGLVASGGSATVSGAIDVLAGGSLGVENGAVVTIGNDSGGLLNIARTPTVFSPVGITGGSLLVGTTTNPLITANGGLAEGTNGNILLAVQNGQHLADINVGGGDLSLNGRLTINPLDVIAGQGLTNYNVGQFIPLIQTAKALDGFVEQNSYDSSTGTLTFTLPLESGYGTPQVVIPGYLGIGVSDLSPYFFPVIGANNTLGLEVYDAARLPDKAIPDPAKVFYADLAQKFHLADETTGIFATVASITNPEDAAFVNAVKATEFVLEKFIATDKFTAGFFTSLKFGGECAAAALTFGIPGVNLFTGAACLLTGLEGASMFAENAAQNLANDPPDPAYHDVFVPTLEMPPITLDGTCQDLSTAESLTPYAVDNADLWLNATTITADRYSTALSASDFISAQMQYNALGRDQQLYNSASALAAAYINCFAYYLPTVGLGIGTPTAQDETDALNYLSSPGSDLTLVNDLLGQVDLSSSDITGLIDATLTDPPPLPDGSAIDGLDTLASAFSATPRSVPEPGTLALLGSGLIGLVFVVRRRKRLG